LPLYRLNMVVICDRIKKAGWVPLLPFGQCDKCL
jgi:hypothetical protein